MSELEFQLARDRICSCAYDIVAGGDDTKVEQMQSLLRDLSESKQVALLVAGLFVFIGEEQYNKALALANNIKEK